MTNYEVWLTSGETITVEADSVIWENGAVSFGGSSSGGGPSLVTMVPFIWIKLVRVKPVDSP